MQTYVVFVVFVVEAVEDAVGVVVRGTIVVIVAAVRRSGVASDIVIFSSTGGIDLLEGAWTRLWVWLWVWV